MNAIKDIMWLNEAGVDEALEATSVNRFEKAAARRAAKNISSPAGEGSGRGLGGHGAGQAPHLASPLRGEGSLPLSAIPAAAIAEARRIADSVKTLEELRAAVMGFEGCGLKKTATNTVFADGNPNAPLMAIGEAPGAEEDKQGIPFCGLSGKLLDQVFLSIGRTREHFYITNTLFWRPPGNRQPTPEELAICEPLVQKHIALVNPKLLVLVGGTAAKSVLNSSVGITRLRGKEFSYTNPYLEGRQIPVMVTFHPSFLLRQPMQKKQAWQDMLAIKHRIIALQ